MTTEERQVFNEEIRMILQQEYLEKFGEVACKAIYEDERDVSHDSFKRIFSDYEFSKKGKNNDEQ